MLREISPTQKIMRGAAWRLLPRGEQYPLPPRLITRKVTNEKEPDRLTVLTYLFHFLFGAATGSVYAAIEDKVPLPSSAKGILMGLAVWIGSYLGWIPLLGILTPANEHPLRRNLLMIIAHVIWGFALGKLTRDMNPRRRYIDL